MSRGVQLSLSHVNNMLKRREEKNIFSNRSRSPKGRRTRRRMRADGRAKTDANLQVENKNVSPARKGMKNVKTKIEINRKGT